MRTKLSILLTITMILALIPMSAFAGVPVTPLDPELVMYADDFEVGDIVAVNFDPYLPLSQLARLNPTNALGPFDAIAPDGVSDYFFATGAREWSHFTFEDKFVNVDGAPDIEFAEITWGTDDSWHTEAMLVYLTDAFVRDSEGDLVPYGADDDGIGYFAGVAWNRIGLEYVDAATRLAVTQSYFGGTRDFEDNEFYRSGPYGTYTQFHLPDEVVYAEGIHLVDITKDVYDLGGNGSFENVVSGTPGALVTLNSDAWDLINSAKITAADVTAVSGTDGNTDGYDLDAIRVYKYVPPSTYGFCGYKLDAETGEGLEEWTIILRDEEGTIIDRTITDRYGKYCFDGLPAGVYTVEEVMEDGWQQVFPDGNGIHEVTLPKDDVVYGIERFTGKIFEIDPLTADATEYYQISGLHMDSVGPNGLAFDQMTGNLYFTTYRGLAELYVFDGTIQKYLGELPGEIANADFFNGKYYYIAGGTTSGFGGPTDDLYEVTFEENGDIAGWTKFADISGGLNSKWTFDGDIAISADGVIYGFGKDNTTGEIGYEFFKVNRDGTDFEMIKDSGYTFSLQLAFSGDGVLYGHDAKGGRFYAVDTDDGSIELISTNSAMLYTDTSSGTLSYNFENKEVEKFEIAGYKLDADTEEGLPDWTINLEKWDETIDIPAFAPFDSTTTGPDGKYCFSGLEAGEYRVSEVMEDGWIQLEPEIDDFHLVTLPAGASDCEEETDLYNFVNAELFDLCGFKYGVNWLDPESMDNPLDGWTIKLMDGDVVVQSTTTDVNGHYCFKGLRAGNYIIVESFGEMNGYGFWEFDSKFWKPVHTDEIVVTLPDDASDYEDADTHHNFYNMCYTDETAWMFGDISHIGLPGLRSNNWGWSLTLEEFEIGEEAHPIMTGIEIYAAAGQNDLDKGYLAGYLDICWDGENVVICNVEAEEWTYLDLEGMKVWVGNEELPKTKKGAYTNAPGQLVIQDGIDYNETVYVAVHFESFAPCEFTN